MFTGIVEEIGLIKLISNNTITIGCTKILENISLGDSIAVNGACLTVIDFNEKSFKANISKETFSKIKCMKVNEYVNLERAIEMNGRLNGHIVSGHIDNVATLVSINKDSNFVNLKIKLDKDEFVYVVKKGAISIDGISLTVADICPKNYTIEIAVIPYTYETTNLRTLKINDKVNIEVDILAKYIEKFLSMRDNKTSINSDFLKRNGFY